MFYSRFNRQKVSQYRTTIQRLPWSFNSRQNECWKHGNGKTKDAKVLVGVKVQSAGKVLKEGRKLLSKQLDNPQRTSIRNRKNM